MLHSVLCSGLNFKSLKYLSIEQWIKYTYLCLSMSLFDPNALYTR